MRNVNKLRQPEVVIQLEMRKIETAIGGTKVYLKRILTFYVWRTGSPQLIDGYETSNNRMVEHWFYRKLKYY